MSTSMSLKALIDVQAQINFYSLELVKMNSKYEANSAKLSKYQQWEEQWNEKYDDCYYAEEGKEVKIGNNIFASGCECAAEEYADEKVRQRDEQVYLELADLDMEYESRKTMLDTLLQELRAEEEALKNQTSTSAQDTNLLNAG